MKAKKSTKILSAFLAAVMVFLMIPFSTFLVSAKQSEYLKLDYTPFLIEEINGQSVYNAQTANLSYDFYVKARKYIDGNIEEFSSIEHQGISYPVESVLYIPSNTYPTCDLLTCIVNFQFGNEIKHVVLIAFRGTDFSDWQEVKTDLDCATGQDGYHDGFEGAAKKHYEKLLDTATYDLGNGEETSFSAYLSKMNAAEKDYTMIVTGHSLGAAVAGIFTSKYLDNTYGITAKNAVAYTFASPLTCSDSQAKKEANKVKNVFNIVNKDDIVTKIGADAFDGQRTGYDLKYTLGKYGSLNFDNHHLGTAYSITKDYINNHINEYTKSFVLYNNYDNLTHTYQRIIFNNGQLIVSGSGLLSGDWQKKTLIEWAIVQNDCSSLLFSSTSAITEIGDYCFAGMSQLTNTLVIPTSVHKIGDYAFFHCGFNGDLIIHSEMKTIGTSAFNGCSNLNSIDARNATEMTWGYDAFANCVGQYELFLPIEDSGTDLAKIFKTYYVQDSQGSYLITVDDTSLENIVLPGDKIYVGRIEDEKLNVRPHYDFHYLLTTGHTDTADNIESLASTSIENVATIDESGCITVYNDCVDGTEFTVVIMDNYKGNPDYDVYDSNRFIHFTVNERNKDFSGGIGTKDRPYLIESAAQLQSIKDYSDKHFKLLNNIDFKGAELSPLGVFEGVLDGNGYSIYGFKMSVYTNTGLFEKISTNATVKNLTIGGNFDATESFLATIATGHNGNTFLYAGGICAINEGTIENCIVRRIEVYAGRNIDWSNESKLYSIVGGIAGQNYNIIKNCTVLECRIHADSETAKDNSPAKCYVYSGGIAGINDGTINACSSLNNEIKGYTYSVDKNDAFTDWREGEAQTYCAGLVAENKDVILDCFVFDNYLEATAQGDGDEGYDIASEEIYVCIANGTMDNCVVANVFTTQSTNSICVYSSPNKNHYYIGESFNLYGLEIRDNNGHIVNGYTVSNFNCNKSGEQTLTISYKTGYSATPLYETFTITIENIIPKAIIVTPKDNFNINSTCSLEDFSATVYYNNGMIDKMDSLIENESDIVKFTEFENLLNIASTQILQMKYHYAYMTNEGKVSASPSFIVYVAVTVDCNCLSTIKRNAKQATTTEYGYTGDIVCSVCQSIIEEGEPIDILECTNHTYSSWTKHSDSQHLRTCTCGEIEYGEHRWDSGVATKPATHLAKGELTRTCLDCGATKTEEISKLAEHSFGKWTKYDEDQHVHVCECNEKEFKPHNWDDGIETITPTYTTVGEMTYTCEDCKATKTEEIPTLEIEAEMPKISISQKSATPGSTIQLPIVISNNPGIAYLRIALEYDSSVLKLESVTNSIPALVMAQGNNILSWDSSSSYMGNGELCVLTFTVAPDAILGDYEIKLTVSECYDENTDDVELYAVSGIVSVIDFVYGDANGDGEVSGKDVIVLRRHLVEPDIEIFAGADANGDGEINGKDVIILRRYLVGTAELGPVA